MHLSRKIYLIVALALMLAVQACRNKESTGNLPGTVSNSDKSMAHDSSYSGEDRFQWQRPDFVISKLGDLTGKTVVDLGAGSGYFAFRLVKSAGKVIAVDIDERMIKLLEEEKTYYSDSIQSRFEARLALPDDPKLRSGEADAILVVNTYAYIQDRVKYFNRLRTALKPGGMLLIVDFKKRNLPIGPDKAFKVNASDVEDELAQAGYTNILTDDTSLAYQYIIKALP